MRVSMKKATLRASKQEQEVILLALQRCGQFMAVGTRTGETPEAASAQTAQRVHKALAFYRRYGSKKSRFSPRPQIPFTHLIHENERAHALLVETEEIICGLSSPQGAKKPQALRARAALLAGRADELEILYDKSMADAARAGTPLMQDGQTFCLTGWVREDKIAVMSLAVEGAAEGYSLTFADPEEGEAVPRGHAFRPLVIRPKYVEVV